MSKKRIDLATGILDERALPNDEFSRLWDSIIIDEAVKENLLCKAVSNFSLRSQISRDVIPLHGVILLTGPPGTGKTSLARGLASMVAKSINGPKARFIEIEPHSLTSSSLGKSQRAVTELLGTTIVEYAEQGPVIVLLDEVESLATDRKKLSMDANPVDVHRATDAVLAQLDNLAQNYPQLLFVATSNFEDAVDEAFISRADLVLPIPLPNAEARRQILEHTINGLVEFFPKLASISRSAEFEKVVSLTDGLDGRRLRKLVAAACAFSRETAIDANRMTAKDLLRAAEHASRAAKSATAGGK